MDVTITIPTDPAIAALQQQVTALTEQVVAMAPKPLPRLSLGPVALSDMARSFYYWSQGPARAAAYAWLGDHVDLTEWNSGESFAQMQAKNPALKRWLYRLDLTVFTSDARAAALPDRLFVLNADGTRKVGTIAGSDRWYYDYGQQETRDIQAAWLREQVAIHDGLFLDEHTDYGTVDPAAITAWLTQLKATVAPKFIIINIAQMWSVGLYAEHAVACGGVCLEWSWSLTQGGGWAVGAIAQLVKRISDGGGIVHCLGWWDGNKQRQASNVGDWDREAMARLALYWLVKAPGVYLDLQSTPQGANLGDGDLSWSTWFDALRMDLGHYVGPLGEPLPGTRLGRFDMGKTPDGSWTRWVHAVEYANACVYVRCMDGWDQHDYGDTTAVSLPVMGRRLQMDGTLGPAITTLNLRNAEAAIVVKP